MHEPQEIEEREHEIAVARVAAAGVAKASGVVCTRVPRESGGGRFVTKVWPVDATTNAILELADHLVALGAGRWFWNPPAIIGGRFSICWRPPG